jgi:hypothetical protein
MQHNQKKIHLDRLKKLQQRSHKCAELRGEYVNTFFSIPYLVVFFIKPKNYLPLIYIVITEIYFIS